MGNILNTAKSTLIIIPVIQTRAAKIPMLPSPKSGNINDKDKAHAIAIIKLAPGPAAATRIISLLGFRSLWNATGTGFAQPKAHAPWLIRSIPNGTIRVPSGSTCLIGFRVKRPARWAVESPN